MPADTTAEQATIRQYCKALRTPTIGFQFQTLADQAIREKHTYTRYLEALLAMEVEERERHTVARRIQEARLPRVKTIEDFDFSQSAVPASTHQRVSRWRLYRSCRARGFDWRMWNR